MRAVSSTIRPGVTDGLTVTRDSRFSRTSVTGREPSSRASSRLSASSGSSRPAWPASSTSRLSCSLVKTASTASLGSTWKSRRMPWETAPRAAVMGLQKRANQTRPGLSHSAAFSGAAIARFFGTISPMTRWKKTTAARAMT